jgi:hypothetical protein
MCLSSAYASTRALYTISSPTPASDSGQLVHTKLLTAPIQARRGGVVLKYLVGSYVGLSLRPQEGTPTRCPLRDPGEP